MGVDFIEAATKLMVGKSVEDMNLPQLGTRNRPERFVGVKAPMFSFTRLGGADPILGVEMASTGEVACFGVDAHEAFLKAMVSANFKIPKKTIALTIQAGLLEEVVQHVWTLHTLGYELLATPETHLFLESKGIPCSLVRSADSTELPNIKSLISNNKIDLVVNLRDVTGTTENRNNYLTRRTAVDFGVPLMTNAQLFIMLTQSLQKLKQGKFQFGKVRSRQYSNKPTTGTNPNTLAPYDIHPYFTSRPIRCLTTTRRSRQAKRGRNPRSSISRCGKEVEERGC
jgi:carbamoyl-phosphate synthase (ammonia)